MQVRELAISGVLLIEPKVSKDSRGFFYEAWQSERYATLGMTEFVQDNHSRSNRAVLRGLHFQVRRPQSQLIYLSAGRIFDAIVDLRLGSSSFGKWCSTELDAERPTQLFMPPGCAHGFCVLSERADVHYKVSEFFDPADDGAIRWDDPDLAIDWPCKSPIVGERDATAPFLRDLTSDRLPQFSKPAPS